MRRIGALLVGPATLLACLGASLAGAQTAPDMSAAQLAVACAPPPTFGPAAPGRIRILGGQDTAPHELFGRGDLVVLSGGSSAGLALDQRYFLERPSVFGHYLVDSSRVPSSGVISGWIRIVAVNAATSIARVDFACDGVLVGDSLEPFTPPDPVATPQTASGEADFSSLGRVLYGNAEARIGGAGNFMIVDRGRDQGVGPGTRFAIYRDLRVSGLPLVAVGEGVVVSVSEKRAVMQILSSRSAVESGDYVARRAAGTVSTAAAPSPAP